MAFAKWIEGGHRTYSVLPFLGYKMATTLSGFDDIFYSLFLVSKRNEEIVDLEE